MTCYSGTTTEKLRNLHSKTLSNGHVREASDIAQELRRRRKRKAWQDISDTAALIETYADSGPSALENLLNQTLRVPEREGSKLYIVRRLVQAIVADSRVKSPADPV